VSVGGRAKCWLMENVKGGLDVNQYKITAFDSNQLKVKYIRANDIEEAIKACGFSLWTILKVEMIEQV
jgi:hypothetical protein